jgi:hypothetical protein
MKSSMKFKPELKNNNGFFKSQYNGNWRLVDECDFIDNIDKLQQKKILKDCNEHELVQKRLEVAKNTFNITSENILCDREFHEAQNLLFYHWYERKYSKCIINKHVIYALNVSTISNWFTKLPKQEIESRFLLDIESYFKFSKFPNYSLYFEYFYDFFPNIEQFSFSELRSKVFLDYLLLKFPYVVFIKYKNLKVLHRFSDIELKMLEETDQFTTTNRTKTHNPILYNNNNLVCFTPNALGEKNFEEFSIDIEGVQTPLFKLLKFRLRNLENNLRVINALPRVGEGWVSETLLFEKIKKSFPNEIVVHHGRPDWLGAQHFDIFFPELNIAIEYQGIQHQKPIDFFGGKEGYIKTQERDLRKKNKCIKNNCDLFYVYPEDDMDKFIGSLPVKPSKQNRSIIERYGE